MYTPPQECLDTLLGPKVVPTKFMFGSSHFGKSKRERWAWKDQAAKDLRDAHPTSYLYIVEDGHLATIGNSAKSSTTDIHAITTTEDDNRPIIRRALSLTFSTQSKDELPMYRSTTVNNMKSRALPPLPAPSSVASNTVSRTSSVNSTLPYADEFARYTAPGQAPSVYEFPQRLHYRRPAHLKHGGDIPSPPASPTKLSIDLDKAFEQPRKAPSPPRRTSSQQQQTFATPPPSPPVISIQPTTIVANSSSKLVRGRSSKFTELLEDRLRSTAGSPLPPFDTDAIPPMPYFPRDLVLPPPSPDSPHVSFAVERPQAPSKHLRVDSAIGSQRSGQSSSINSARSSMEQRASSEMYNLLGSKAATGIIQSKGFAHAPLERTSSTKLQKRGLALSRKQSLPHIIPAPYVRSSTPAEDYMMSGGLGPVRSSSVSTTGSRSDRLHLSSNVSSASSVSSFENDWPVYQAELYEEKTKPALLPGVLPRRSASIASSRPISTLSQIPFVCTAEVMPVGLKSPVIAQGSARLVTC